MRISRVKKSVRAQYVQLQEHQSTSSHEAISYRRSKNGGSDWLSRRLLQLCVKAVNSSDWPSSMQLCHVNNTACTITHGEGVRPWATMTLPSPDRPTCTPTSGKVPSLHFPLACIKTPTFSISRPVSTSQLTPLPSAHLLIQNQPSTQRCRRRYHSRPLTTSPLFSRRSHPTAMIC